MGGLVCFFVLSPALFTPWGFGADYTNHIWLVWQQGLAISHSGHPTLYLQTPSGIFQPLYGFYGGTLYASVGALSALLGNHAYTAYLISIGAAAAIAYGGMWWLGRQLGLSRWVAHLPAFVVVTAAYYLTDAYARGAWTELVALSAVPLFVAGVTRLLTGPWRAGPVTLFVLGTLVMTGSHNLTLLWSALILAPLTVAVWLAVGEARPAPSRIAAVGSLGLAAVGINAWFLLLDIAHGSDVRVWVINQGFVENEFSKFFFFDNLGNVLDPLRHFPVQSTTYGLVIAAPVAAFALSLALTGLAWPQLRRTARALKAIWLILLAAMAVLVVMLVMPASWWLTLGSPFTSIQYPYRLAGWLMLAVAVQLAISLRFARGLPETRRQIAGILAAALVLATVVQATAQLYPRARVDGRVNEDIHARSSAFANGPTTPPDTYYDPFSYADASLPEVNPPPGRLYYLPIPSPGQTRLEVTLPRPRDSGPVSTTVAGGPYAVRLEGVRVVGRNNGGAIVVKPPPGRGPVRLSVIADAGTLELVGVIVSLLSLAACVGLVVVLALRRRLPLSSPTHSDLP